MSNSYSVALYELVKMDSDIEIEIVYNSVDGVYNKNRGFKYYDGNYRGAIGITLQYQNNDLIKFNSTITTKSYTVIHGYTKDGTYDYIFVNNKAFYYDNENCFTNMPFYMRPHILQAYI